LQRPQVGANRKLLRGKSETLLEERNLAGAVGQEDLKLLLRGGASTRLHPNRRASMDHKPGPNIARAPAMVPSKSGTKRSPPGVAIWPNWMKATSVPTMGVHRPTTRRTPDDSRNADVIVAFSAGSLHKIELARATSTYPTTIRIRSKPRPGQPPANVEYRRRK
jgi:hypothetical protein